jgi:hypothetical protein
LWGGVFVSLLMKQIQKKLKSWKNISFYLPWEIQNWFLGLILKFLIYRKVSLKGNSVRHTEFDNTFFTRWSGSGRSIKKCKIIYTEFTQNFGMWIKILSTATFLQPKWNFQILKILWKRQILEPWSFCLHFHKKKIVIFFVSFMCSTIKSVRKF